MSRYTYFSRRFILREDNPERAVQSIANALGWKRVGKTKADPKNAVPYSVKWSTDHALVIYVFDDVSNQAAVLVGGNDDVDAFEKVVRVLHERLKIWSLDELIDAVDSTGSGPSYAEAVIRAGLGAPYEFDARFYDRIGHALSNEDSAVRQAAAWATSYAGWPQYSSVLEAALKKETDDEVRAHIGSILEAIDMGGLLDR